MTDYPLTDRIAARISDGEILHAKGVTCGSYLTAIGPRRFATLDRRGAGEIHDAPESAAALFLEWVGTEAALRAIHAEWLS